MILQNEISHKMCHFTCRTNLSTAQIVEQVVAAKRLLAEDVASGGKPAVNGVTNIVFMGMGEPLHNLPAVLAAVDILCDPLGLQLSHNKVPFSSSSLYISCSHPSPPSIPCKWEYMQLSSGGWVVGGGEWGGGWGSFLHYDVR